MYIFGGSDIQVTHESRNFHLVYDVFKLLLDTCMQGCERSSFNLVSDFYASQPPPPPF